MFPWTAFLPYILIVAYTPGPNNIMSMNNAAHKGFRRALPFNFGILSGFFLVMLLCTVFSTLLFTLIPRIQIVMKILGAAYMLYLALVTLLPSIKHNVKESNGSFLTGAALQFINVKIMIYGITAMSSFILPRYTSLPVLVCFALLLALNGFIATLFWTAFGSLFSRVFAEHGKILSVIMALLLVYCAVSLFV